MMQAAVRERMPTSSVRPFSTRTRIESLTLPVTVLQLDGSLPIPRDHRLFI